MDDTEFSALRERAELGDKVALKGLANLARNKDYIALDELAQLTGEGNEKAAKELKQLAAEGYADGQILYWVGLTLLNKGDIEKPDNDTVGWLVVAIELGSYDALRELMTLASNGAANAQEELERIVNNGNHEALEHLAHSAGVGDPDALEEIVRLAEKGVAEASDELEQLAADGKIDSWSCCYIGSMYYDGEGVRRSYAKAAEWFGRAAEMGDADAQYRLGASYLDGPKAEWKEEAAYRWISSAARKGHPGALRRLERDAGDGRAFARYELGMMLLNGEGVERSEDKAMELLGKAAEAGVTKAEPGLNQARAMVREKDARKKGERPVRKGLKRLLGLRSEAMRIRVDKVGPDVTVARASINVFVTRTASPSRSRPALPTRIETDTGTPRRRGPVTRGQEGDNSNGRLRIRNTQRLNEDDERRTDQNLGNGKPGYPSGGRER